MENKYTYAVAFVGVLLIASFFIFRNTGENKRVNSGSHMMPDGTMMNNNAHQSMYVRNDEEFIKGMIPHHEEAVATAQEVLARGGSFPEIKTLAENIVTSQTVEIGQMKKWHEDWFGASYTSDDGYEPMMRDLASLSGADLDKVFLEDMVMHHMGAVMMSEQALSFSKREEIRNLSNAIIKAQNTEIALMQGWLKSKFK